MSVIATEQPVGQPMQGRIGRQRQFGQRGVCQIGLQLGVMARFIQA